MQCPARAQAVTPQQQKTVRRHGDRHSSSATNCGTLPDRADRPCYSGTPDPSVACMLQCPGTNPTHDARTIGAQATEVAAKLHVPVSKTAEWAALMDHVAEIDKTCALLAIVPITAIRGRSSLV